MNNWDKYRETFLHQLELNINQLNNNYPEHWSNLIEIISKIPEIKRIVDVGCGCGSLYTIKNRHLPKLDYIGYDYAQHAINVANEAWRKNCFYVKDYKDLKREDFKDGDILVANGLTNILPNGDECAEFLLRLCVKYLLLSRTEITNKESYFTVGQAYCINTCYFRHNYDNLLDLFDKYEYDVQLHKLDNDCAYNVFLIKRDNK